MHKHWPLQDTSNSGANVKRLDQESKDQMKEIESSIAAKKREVGGGTLFLMVTMHYSCAAGVTCCKTPIRCHKCEHM